MRVICISPRGKRKSPVFSLVRRTELPRFYEPAPSLLRPRTKVLLQVYQPLSCWFSDDFRVTPSWLKAVLFMRAGGYSWPAGRVKRIFSMWTAFTCHLSQERRIALFTTWENKYTRATRFRFKLLINSEIEWEPMRTLYANHELQLSFSCDSSTVRWNWNKCFNLTYSKKSKQRLSDCSNHFLPANRWNSGKVCGKPFTNEKTNNKPRAQKAPKKVIPCSHPLPSFK